MNFKEFKSLMEDPATDPYWVGMAQSIYNSYLDLAEDGSLIEPDPETPIKQEDIDSLRAGGMGYNTHIPYTDEEIRRREEGRAAAAAAKAAEATAEDAKYTAGINAVKGDADLWAAYNSDENVRKKIDNSCRFCGTGVLNSKAYFLGLLKK